MYWSSSWARVINVQVIIIIEERTKGTSSNISSKCIPSNTIAGAGQHSFNTCLRIVPLTENVNVNIAFYVAFCTILAISRQKEARSRDYALLLFRMTSRVIYSARYHRQQCTLHVFEQFGALYMYNHDDKYPSRPEFEPGTPRLQAPVDTTEPSGLAYRECRPTH